MDTGVLLLALSCLIHSQVLAQDDDLRLPPEITVKPKREIVYKDGDNKQIICSAIGIPEPEYIWTKDNKTLEQTPRIDIKGGTITITKANKYLDDGLYQCSAKNKYGVALTAKTVLKQAHTTYRSKTTPKELDANQYEPFRLDLYDSVESYPDPVFSWKTVVDAENTGAKDIIPNARIAIDQVTGTMFFANIIDTDDKEGRIYKLDVSNSIQDVKIGGSPYRIRVTPKASASSAPNVMAPQPDENTFEYVGIKGKNATLMCFFGGHPTPTISWLLPQNHPHQSRIDHTMDSNTKCHIRDLIYEDEGDYTCTGTNSEGKAKVKISLKIESIPTFITAPQNVNATEGGRATFRCAADAKPAATVEWFSNGILINPRDPGNSRFTLSDRELTVINVCKDCQGTPKTDIQVFQCKISNKHGEDYASAYLNVLAATKIYSSSPSEVILDPSNKDEEGMVANLTCRAKTDALKQKELDIQWWFEGRRIYHDEGHYHLSEKDQVLEVVLKNATEDKVADAIGEYKCIARTQYSNDTKSFHLKVKGVTKEVKAMIERLWWIFVVIFIVLLLFIICMCCCIHAQRNRGEEYPVDEKERLNGNDPEAELEEMAFQDYQRPIESATLRKGSRASLGSTQHLDQSTDEISLFTDPGRFDEDGSFMDNYGTGSRRQLLVPSNTVSEA